MDKIRLSEHICNEISLGNWEGRYGWLHNEFYVSSVGRGEIIMGQDEEWRNSWTLHARKGGFLFGKKLAYVTRGSESTLPISATEMAMLYDCYQSAKAQQKEREQIKKEEHEAARLRLTDWP